ncbi:linear amide C-N hydrolase [Castellaniella sp.]|uniref:linear amide C-N hydrolase n=1 Tax=Castellaniella sp. TaxID=1955812 RepID=UPI00356879BB
MCTSLLYLDACNRAYLGRTLELSLELPYLVARFPKGARLTSKVQGYPELDWVARHAFLAVTMPDAPPASAAGFGPEDLKVIEGLNDAGLTFSMQSYPQAGGPQAGLDSARAALSAADLGAFLLGQCATVAEARAVLDGQQIVLERIPILGGLEVPFHFGLHDSTGASLVVEFHRGERSLYDNPVGVMTNAPRFSWHLTNLDNYTHLSNVDHSRARFMNYDAQQPGSGIAKAGVPGSDSSVDRFIRAAHYARFAEKQTDPDKAVQMVAHIMNNFDRPRGITIDPPDQGSGHLQVAGHATDGVPTEFTSWTSLTDIERRRLYLRDSKGMNYIYLDLAAQADIPHFSMVPMKDLVAPVAEVTF